MNNFLKHFGWLLALIAIAQVGCKPEQNEPAISEQECTFTLQLPLAANNGSYSNRVVTLKSNSNGKETKLQPTSDSFKQKLLEGSYQLIFTANLEYRSNKLGQVTTSVTLEENIVVSSSKTAFTLAPQYTESTAGFVIEELSFSPSVDPQNPKRTFKYVEQYIKITNNSDVTLYADSLGILESSNLTDMKRDYIEGKPDGFLPVGFLYMIPGDGKTYPVKPGASLIIANDAQDHSKVFPGAVDLSKADFEIYDISSNPRFQDVDNPEVPNLVPYYKSSLTVHSFHQRGCTAIALAKVPVSPEKFTEEYHWEGKYLFVYGDYKREMTDKAYKVPYEWIIDLVNLAIQDEVSWLFTPPTLDAGHTGWLNTFNEQRTNEMAVIRKVDHVKEGRKYLMDTNNSTNDFNRRVRPSLKQK